MSISVTLWTVAHEAPLFMRLSQQEYRSGSPGIKHVSYISCTGRLGFLLAPHGKPICTIQFTSAAQSCLTLCNPMDCSMLGFRVHHQLPELAQTHVHQVDDAIQPSYCTLLSPSPPAFNLSQHQGLFLWVSSLHQVAKVLEFQLQHQSFPWIFRTDNL